MRRPDFPKGPLNPPDPDTIAVRVAITVRFSGTTDVLLEKRDIDRYGSVDALIMRWREDLAQRLWEQGGLNEDDIEIDDADQWDEAAMKWEVIPTED